MTVQSRLLAGGVAAALAVAALACDTVVPPPLPMALRYTMQVEVIPAPADETPSTDILSLMVPGGSIAMTTTLSDLGIRMEWETPMPGLPPAAVLLHRPDGSTILLDPTERRHWTISIPSVPVGGGTPAVRLERTGEQDIIAGEMTERFTFEIDLPVPGSPQTASANDEAPIVALSGEAWVAPRYRAYTALASAGLPAMATFGLDVLAREGLQMRQVLRSPAFGDRRVESTVSNVSEEPLAPELFDIPPGYTPGGELSPVVR